MKVSHAVIITTFIALASTHAEGVRQLLQDAIAAPRAGVVETITATGQSEWEAISEKPYVTARNRIIELGQTAVPELQAIATDPSSTWQQRVMAGICLERIQRGDEIRAFANHDWRNDPALRDEPDWGNRQAVPGKFFALAEERLLATGLQSYWLEIVWKRISEHPQRDAGRWHLRAARTLEKAGASDLVHVARELVQGSKHPDDIYGNVEWYYHYLLRVKDRESFRLLFDLWLRNREWRWPISLQYFLESHPGEEERCRAYAAESTTAVLEVLLELAGPEDAVWISQKLQNIPLGFTAERALNQYRARISDTTRPDTTRGR